MTDTFILETLEGLVDIRCSMTGKSIVGDKIAEAQFKKMQDRHSSWLKTSNIGELIFWPRK